MVSKTTAVASMTLRTLKELSIEDEKSFRHVALYADLKEILRRSEYKFRVLSGNSKGRWDRALLLNLTFWGASDGGDILTDERIAADVVTHTAWHHLAARKFAHKAGAPLSTDALFLGESIASAFDLYLVGRLIGHSSQSSFLQSHVAHMSETAETAGLDQNEFEALLEAIAAEPERAFEDLRQLLFDATCALASSNSAEEGLRALESFSGHRMSALLHLYELSNWALYARAYGVGGVKSDESVLGVDRAMRAAPDSVEWLSRHWVRPELP